MAPRPPAGALRRISDLTTTVVDRLPTRLQYVSRRIGRRAVPLARAVRDSRLVTPLVSIVLPVYNVSSYLPACLDSLLGQSYARLQIIAVDDGSTDDSAEILRRYAARDPRLEIIRQANAGLGAARNAGVPAARGRYLMFVDSDDVLLPEAITSYVRSLRASGSDFAVGAYQRVNAAGTSPAAWWVRAAHRSTRRGVRLADYPEILVNAVAWSKFYRRDFWLREGMAFPTGVLYEDQAVSARAYARARTFDVLATTTYQWRIRDDRSSITQQNVDVADLRARLDAASASLAELDLDGLGEARDVRLAQLLSNDFPLSIKAAQHADDAFWATLRDGLSRLVAGAGPHVWDRVSTQHRLAIALVTADQRDAAVDFVGLGHNNPKNSPAVLADGQVYVQFPAREALGLAERDPLLALAAHQTALVTAVTGLAWHTGDDGRARLEITGWAYLDNVDHGATTTSQRLWLEHVEGTGRIEVPLTPAPSPAVTVASKHRYADYESTCFRAEVDVERLTAPGRWSAQVQVEAAGIVRLGPLRGLRTDGSAGRATAGFRADGASVMPSTGGGGLQLTVRPPQASAASWSLVERTLRVHVRGHSGFQPHELQLNDEAGDRSVRVPLRRRGEEAEGEVTVPVSPDVPSSQWGVRVLGLDGRLVPLTLTTAPEPPAAGQNPTVRRTRYGNLGVLDEPWGVRVAAVEVLPGAEPDPGPDPDRPTRLRVTGTARVPAGRRLQLAVRAPHATAPAAAEVDDDGGFEVEIALQADPWGRGVRPLPVGSYQLSASVPAEAEIAGEELPLHVVGTVALGRGGLAGPLHVTLVPAGGDGLGVLLGPPLRDDELGSRHQERLQRQLQARVAGGEPSGQPGAVLLRSYFGEVCGCNPLAVHRELRRRYPDRPLHWAVRDHSVDVPEGGLPVIYESAAWYRLLHDAELYMDNMHQAIYHRKAAHQRQIQTFHGYPFKQMGLPHWRLQNRDVAHIRSYLDRAADWDFFVSPASYGTALLKSEFGYPGEMTEVGYPRNDVLQSPDADALVAAARQRLGIPPGATAVLYAPTFRDQLSKDDFAASMVDFLDPEQLAALLGEHFVIMVRGHAFNARVAERVTSSAHVVDVTDHPDIAELCLASDVAILDYSSLRFDYALTGKPMIFLVPDLQEWTEQSRGALFAYEPTAPGPLVETTEELVAALRDLDGVRAAHAEAYATFRRDFLDLDDGHATERLVDLVLGPAPR